MNKYFVKRLEKPIPENYNNPHVSYWDGQESTALFLCSRDIQVGDIFKIDYPSIASHLEDRICTEVYDPNKDLNIGEKLPIMYMINKTGAHLNHGECFKVIGEISSKAIFVSEGQEFAETELEIPAKEFSWNHPIIVKVKCKCCNKYC